MGITPVQLPETEPWLRLPDESNLWYSRFVLFLNMGPARTMTGAVHMEDAQQKREKTKFVPGAWRQASRKYRWDDRAECWDEYRRKEVFNLGFAAELKRIEALNSAAEQLHKKVMDMIAALKPPKGGFQDMLYGRYLETLEALAKETGGRVQKKELSGPHGSALEVLLFMPEQEHEGDDPSIPVDGRRRVPQTVEGLLEDISEEDG